MTLYLFVLFCFDGHISEGSWYPIRNFASHAGTEQTFLLPWARSILTLRLLGIEPSTLLDTKQPHGPKQIGILYTPGGT